MVMGWERQEEGQTLGSPSEGFALKGTSFRVVARGKGWRENRRDSSRGATANGVSERRPWGAPSLGRWEAVGCRGDGDSGEDVVGGQVFWLLVAAGMGGNEAGVSARRRRDAVGSGRGRTP